MSKTEVMAERVTELEAEYRAKLVGALQECASGRWGLFGHNEHLMRRPAVPAVVEELVGLDREIERLRGRLGLEPFELHASFMASRGAAAPNAPGEPRQARAWLDQLGS